MSKLINDKTEELKDRVSKELIRTINETLLREDIIYKGEAYPLIINPIILEEEAIVHLNKVAQEWNDTIKNLTTYIKEHEKIRSQIESWDPLYKTLLEEVTNTDVVPVCFSRIDGIFSEGKLRLVEFNTNSPGGLLTLEKMHHIIQTSLDLKGEYQYMKGSEALKQHFIKKHDNSGKFVIIGKEYDEERSEHLMWSKWLREEGIDAITIAHTDPLLKVEGNQLNYKGELVTTVYKRVVPFNEVPELMDAAKKGLVKTINPFSSYLFADKRILGLLHEHKKELNTDFIENHIAKTIILTEEEKENIINNKNEWVVKKGASNCGKDVYIGKTFSQEEWRKIMNGIDSSYVAQEYIDHPERDFVDNRRKGSFTRKHDTNIYILEDKAIMPYIRVNAPNNYKSNNACGSSESVCLIEVQK